MELECHTELMVAQQKLHSVGMIMFEGYNLCEIPDYLIICQGKRIEIVSQKNYPVVAQRIYIFPSGTAMQITESNNLHFPLALFQFNVAKLIRWMNQHSSCKSLKETRLSPANSLRLRGFARNKTGYLKNSTRIIRIKRICTDPL